MCIFEILFGVVMLEYPLLWRTQFFSCFETAIMMQGVRAVLKRGREARYGKKRTSSQVLKLPSSKSSSATASAPDAVFREAYTREFQRTNRTAKPFPTASRRSTLFSSWTRKSPRWPGGRQDDSVRISNFDKIAFQEIYWCTQYTLFCEHNRCAEENLIFGFV